MQAKLRALLADDHDQMWSAVERILGDEFEVTYVPDGRALLDMLEQMSPDVVILDVSMPRMSGIEALQALQKKGVPIPPTVVCSMQRDHDVVNQALAAGARGYVFKARAPFELRDAIDAALDDRQFVSNDVIQPSSSPRRN
ncbi:MAG: response regulator transcription factor [Bryobacterales bacterium]|nr:response regulator transcription factor [Bryobacterales bacterium]